MLWLSTNSLIPVGARALDPGFSRPRLFRRLSCRVLGRLPSKRQVDASQWRRVASGFARGDMCSPFLWFRLTLGCVSGDPWGVVSSEAFQRWKWLKVGDMNLSVYCTLCTPTLLLEHFHTSSRRVRADRGAAVLPSGRMWQRLGEPRGCGWYLARGAGTWTLRSRLSMSWNLMTGVLDTGELDLACMGYGNAR